MWLLTFFYKKIPFQWGHFDTETLSFLSAGLITYPESSSHKVPTLASWARRRWSTQRAELYRSAVTRTPGCALVRTSSLLCSLRTVCLARPLTGTPAQHQSWDGNEVEAGSLPVPTSYSHCPARELFSELLQLSPQLWPWAVRSAPLLCCLSAHVRVHFSSFPSVFSSSSTSKYIIRFNSHDELCSLCA